MKSKVLQRILYIPQGIYLKFISFISEASRDAFNRKRFANVIIDRKCLINQDSKISPFVHILENCIINNVSLSSYSYVGRNCLIQNATIGKFCSIANDVFIGLGKHPTDYFSTSPLFYRRNNTFNLSLVGQDLQFEEYKKIDIGHDVWIGARAIILDGLSIGHGAIIAANSVVTKDVPAYAILGGVPAKIIKYRFNKNKIDMLLESQWWDWELEKIKKNLVLLNR